MVVYKIKYNENTYQEEFHFEEMSYSLHLIRMSVQTEVTIWSIQCDPFITFQFHPSQPCHSLSCLTVAFWRLDFLSFYLCIIRRIVSFEYYQTEKGSCLFRTP